MVQAFEVVNGKVQSRFGLGGVEINEKTIMELENLSERGLIKDEVRVTPGLPFMISIILGYSRLHFMEI
jgi:hypothetical protein